MGKVVGIDLGTTNSVVAVIEGGKPVVIANAEGMRTTPSVVAFSKEGERLVGQMARRQTVLNPQNTFYNIKRYVGRRYAELSSDAKKVPYTVRKDDVGNVRIRCPRLDRDFAPEEVSAMVLRKLADEASRYLGQPVSGAVITVPAYFNDAQRQATRDAGRIAGLEVKRIINEPTAAALAYGLDQQFNQTILVFDLGGGTFDVSILDVRNGVFEVKATSGDTQLGGLNFDKQIVNWLADTFLEAEGVDLRRDRQALQRLTEAAEKAKIELSGLPTAEINLPFITATADGPKHIETKLTRSQFETLCADLIGRLRGPLQQAMDDARLSPSQIDEVVLVGGSSRIPMVQQLVRSVLSKEPSQNVNPDEAVAVGAAIQAGILTAEVQDIMLLDVTPLSLGLETIGGVMKKVIPRNTTIPVRRSDVFSTSENNQTVVEVHIVQGEREMAVDNKSLGRFKLMGIPPAPRGIPQVQVAFDIDANGILQVSAMDKTTGREQSITVQEASNLSEDDIQRMLKEAEEFADVDRGQRERIEKRNRADTLTFQAERAMRSVSIDFGLQFARDRKRRIDELIQDLRDALKREDERMIDMVQAELQDELYELNREAYLYDADNDDGNLFGQIGDTLKKAFADDDDYYRRDYDWDGGSQWGRSSGGSRDRWDDWDDSWSQPRQEPPRRDSYDTPYRSSDYGAPPPDRYEQDRYERGRYGQEQYGRDRYEQDRYERDQYSQGQYGQDQYSQDQYSQNRYEQDRYEQDRYERGRYDTPAPRGGRPDYGAPQDGDYSRPYGREDYGRRPPAPEQDYDQSWRNAPSWESGPTDTPGSSPNDGSYPARGSGDPYYGSPSPRGRGSGDYPPADKGSSAPPSSYGQNRPGDPPPGPPAPPERASNPTERYPTQPPGADRWSNGDIADPWSDAPSGAPDNSSQPTPPAPRRSEGRPRYDDDWGDQDEIW